MTIAVRPAAGPDQGAGDLQGILEGSGSLGSKSFYPHAIIVLREFTPRPGTEQAANLRHVAISVRDERGIDVVLPSRNVRHDPIEKSKRPGGNKQARMVKILRVSCRHGIGDVEEEDHIVKPREKIVVLLLHHSSRSVCFRADEGRRRNRDKH